MTTYTQLPTRYHSLVAASAGSILLQSSRCDAENYRSYLFLRPQRILSASSALFEQIEIALAQGCYVAGFLAYECGEGLEALGDNSAQNSLLPKVWFGVYSHAFVFDHRTGEFEGASPEDFFADKSLFADDSEPSQSPVPQHSAPQPVAIEHLHFGLSEQEYAAKIDAIHEYIRAGDTYQVNFTDALRFDLAGSPDELFSALIASQPVPYSAFLHGDGWRILSFSPELFFRVAGRSILTRPMKGTARRGMDGVEDEAIAQWLAADLKNRSENVMIVDLLRNDLGRLCEFGSVRVDQLCAVERYETLFQMTSQISGTLRSGVRPRDLFASLFPCGSITGAPKHRTMQIIHELERGPRGVYTGAIGFFSPQREAVFSVPIRTVVLEGQSGTMGVGSGIVIDSQADDEFRESLLKSEFLTQREESFQLIESLLWQDGYPLLALHLERLESSARYFGFAFERSAILSAGSHGSNLCYALSGCGVEGAGKDKDLRPSRCIDRPLPAPQDDPPPTLRTAVRAGAARRIRRGSLSERAWRVDGGRDQQPLYREGWTVAQPAAVLWSASRRVSSPPAGDSPPCHRTRLADGRPCLCGRDLPVQCCARMPQSDAGLEHFG